tara:strand:+ start:406 stop:774 length:369 start_codon:yes stop_codon:yes gene_type:complete
VFEDIIQAETESSVDQSAGKEEESEVNQPIGKEGDIDDDSAHSESQKEATVDRSNYEDDGDDGDDNEEDENQDISTKPKADTVEEKVEEKVEENVEEKTNKANPLSSSSPRPPTKFGTTIFL